MTDVDRLFHGYIDGEPRLLVSRPGFPVLEAIGDPDKMAFDSDWLATQNIHAQGVSTASDPIGDGFWVLSYFAPLGFLPIVWVTAQSRHWSNDWQPIGLAPETFRTRIYPGGIGVRQGDIWSGYSRPTVAMRWIVFAARVWE